MIFYGKPRIEFYGGYRLCISIPLEEVANRCEHNLLELDWCRHRAHRPHFLCLAHRLHRRNFPKKSTGFTGLASQLNRNRDAAKFAARAPLRQARPL